PRILMPPGMTSVLRNLLGIWSLTLMFGAPFVYGIFKAVEWRWWISGIRFGDVWFESELSRGALVGLYWKVIGWYLLIAASLGAYVYLCGALVANISNTTMVK